MGPQNALESSGYMLLSGDEALIKKLEPELSRMTGKLVYFGPETRTAAGMKLIGNLFLISLAGALSDVLSLAKSLDIPANEVSHLFDLWNPGSMVTGRLKRIMKADFSHPSWELNMARKDARLMMEETEKEGTPLTVIPAIAGLMDHWIAKGHGHDDWMIIGQGVPAKK
jgi:3-hydroxyisobutyrate dehydrogenase